MHSAFTNPIESTIARDSTVGIILGAQDDVKMTMLLTLLTDMHLKPRRACVRILHQSEKRMPILDSNESANQV